MARYRYRVGRLLAFLVAVSLQAQPSALKIIREKCLKCHSGETAPNGLKLDLVDNMIRGGKRGPALVPFKPDESLIYIAISGTGDKVPQMPPFIRLSEAQAKVIRNWIYMGAQQKSMSSKEP